MSVQQASATQGIAAGAAPSLLARLRHRIWPTHPDTPPLTLNQRRIYVLPTRAGLIYFATLVLMLIASINYNLSLGYGLTFLMTGLGVITIVHTFRNLAGLSISPGRHQPGFAGELVHFSVRLDGRRTLRPALRLQLTGGAAIDENMEGSRELSLPLHANARGWQAMPRLTLSTVWPLGLVRAWAYARLPERCLVYPSPAVDAPPPIPAPGEGGRQRSPEPDDFFGLRPHQVTDFIQHIAWKASARQDEGLLTKQFAADQGDVLYFDLQHTPGADLETRLSILARWTLDAQRANQCFGLKLGNTTLAPAQGPEHLHACLQALALHV